MTLKTFAYSTALCALAFLPMHAQAQDDVEVKLSTGFDYSEGDYGDPVDTKILYIPVTAKVTKGNWSGKVTVPYISIEGPSAVLGEGVVVDVANNTSTSEENGLGDVVVALTRTIDLVETGLYVDVTGKVKIPTADEDKGLGTGEADYTVAVDLTKVLGDAYVFGGAGYKFVGDNSRFQLDDVLLLNVGAGYQLTPKLGIGAVYDFREAAGSGDDPSEATGYITYKLANDLSLQAYGVVGFSDGSPDAGVGAQLGYKISSPDK